MKSKYIENWEYEYGGVQKRSIWSKTKLVIFLVLMALWFIPVLGCYILWDRFFGVEE
jgi:zona occludens toxin (predicted ATPase)